jgi:hypothetical protein
VQVVDYDATADKHYSPLTIGPQDSYANAGDDELIGDPRFHAQNVYAIVMRTLGRFEAALGRRVSWAFLGHQLQVAPHAFTDANAFYSRRDQALLFGYFPGEQETVFTSLSHDVVAHETTHALLDGLRERFTDPSSPQQAAFHEGLSDVVAILSVFSLPDVVSVLMASGRTSIPEKELSIGELQRTALLGLADQMGKELNIMRGALRRSVSLPPNVTYLKDWTEPHALGEVFVAAMLTSFLNVWTRRLESLGKLADGGLSAERVVEEGVNAANHLLTMAIRALDYTPAVDLQFGDYLSALLTADLRVSPDDSKYRYRDIVRKSFTSYGIEPSSNPAGDGIWEPPTEGCSYRNTNFEQLQHDSSEAFRFLWNNRKALCLYEDAFTRVLSVLPTVRLGPDGFFVKETVASYVQILDLTAGELQRLKIEIPPDMPLGTTVTLYGGGILLFNDYGQLAYHVRNRLSNEARQSERLKYLWEYGFFQNGKKRRFAELHRQRSLMGAPNLAREQWS